MYDADMERVRHFGRRWRAVYILRKDLRVSQLALGTPPTPFGSVYIRFWGRAELTVETHLGTPQDQTPGEEASFNVLYWLFGDEWYFRRNDTPWKRFRNWLPG